MNEWMEKLRYSLIMLRRLTTWLSTCYVHMASLHGLFLYYSLYFFLLLFPAHTAKMGYPNTLVIIFNQNVNRLVNVKKMYRPLTLQKQSFVSSCQSLSVIL